MRFLKEDLETSSCLIPQEKKKKCGITKYVMSILIYYFLLLP